VNAGCAIAVASLIAYAMVGQVTALLLVISVTNMAQNAVIVNIVLHAQRNLGNGAHRNISQEFQSFI
jgi:hypothetical protein